MRNRLLLICLLLLGFGNQGEKFFQKAPKAKIWVEKIFADDRYFQKIPKPKKGDWLYHFRERGETFLEYLQKRVVRKTKQRRKIILQPLGNFSPARKKLLQTLREFTSLYFSLPVEVYPPLSLQGVKRRKRRFGYQYHTGDILFRLLLPRLPKDAICYLGITMEDLYPDEDWNFVFGEASLRARVGVYSLARYFPEFWGEKETREKLQRAKFRAFKVIAHETAHMFALPHCVYYLCVMNGANSLQEMDRQPLWLCPVCISKLHFQLGFSPVQRYQKLSQFLKKEGFLSAASWYEKQRKLVEKRIKQKSH